MSEIVSIEVTDKTLAIPVDNKSLGEFISGLLGQPQTLERSFDEPFSVDHQWFLHFFSLIQQRIQQQNAPDPLAFDAEIEYRDKIRRKITSWQAFEHFSETQNIISVRVKFHLAFLIRFPSKHVPERQEIILTFDSRDHQENFVENFVGRGPTIGCIKVEIRHTERTWADDILRLIETEVAMIQTTESLLKKRLRKMFLPLASFAFPLMFLASMIYSTWSKHGGENLITAQTQSIAESGNIDMHSLHEKVDLLLSRAESAAQSRFSDVIVFLYSIGFAAILFFSGLFLAKASPSFVILSSAAKKNKEKTLEKLKRKNLLILASILGSIFLGVVGNFVYDFVK